MARLPNRGTHVTSFEQSEMIRRCLAGETCQSPGLEFGLSRSYVSRMLKRKGVPTGRSGTSRLTFAQERDIARLYLKGMAARLRAGGMRPGNRSFVCKALAKSAHFWRGLIDGDGSIGFYNNTPVLQVVGGWKLLHQFSRYIRRFLPWRVPKINKCAGIWHLSIYGPDADFMIRKLYLCGGPGLDRKSQKARTVIFQMASRTTKCNGYKYRRYPAVKACSRSGGI